MALCAACVLGSAPPARALSVTGISASANCDAVTAITITGFNVNSTALTVRDGAGILIAWIGLQTVAGQAGPQPGPFVPFEGPADNTQWTVNDGVTSIMITPSAFASQCAPASLTVDAGNLDAVVVRGGIASPPSKTYGVANTGGSAIYQPATAYFPGGVAFFDLSGATTIGPFGSGGVTLTFNFAASHLAPGSYTATLAFSNAAKLSLVTTRQITLTVLATRPHDFNRDGNSDILWYNTGNGQAVAWLVNGTTVTGGGSVGFAPAPWTIVGQRDFNGDGFSDILWRNGTTGQLLIWFLNGPSVIGGGSPGLAASPWMVAGTGDFNGDGMGDVLWYNTNTGQTIVWFLNGASVIGSGSPGAAASPWAIVGTGDFNGDGKSDVLWLNTATGLAVMWFVSGGTVIGGGSVGPAPSPWTIAETGDFNGDNRTDILWYNSTSGQLIIWLLNGASVTGTGSPGTAPSPWQLQNANTD